jgi:hypothetical protein
MNKFGWSYPAGCNGLPDDEEPLIKDICPHCDAVNVAWEEVEVVLDNEGCYGYTLCKCPYCSKFSIFMQMTLQI